MLQYTKASEEKQLAFLHELTELTRKHGLAIGGCGCCGSPFLGDANLDERAGYIRGPHGEEVRWVSPDDEYEWAMYSDRVIRANGGTAVERETTTDETLGSGELLLATGTSSTFVGIAINGPFRTKCPCGVEGEIKLQEIVDGQDIPFPCGNPNHWLVKFYPEVG